MTVAKGAIATGVKIAGVRDLTRDDLTRLEAPRQVTRLAKIRESHHALARLIASGLSNAECAEATGYSYNRVSMFRKDPAFQELVSKYQAEIHERFLSNQDEYYALLRKNQLQAERMISDHLDEADDTGELPGISTLLRIARDAADRTGYGKHTTQTNVNVDFASQLEATMRRSGKTIDGSGTPAAPSRPAPGHAARSMTPVQDLVPRRKIA